MGLFQRNPYQNSQHYSLFTMGANKTVLVVGLGNPGKEYGGTRHNVGFAALEAFAEAHEFEAWVTKKDLKCQLAGKTLGETRVLLCKPTTFMNLSGEAVQKVMHFYKLPLEQLLVVHDELDLPFGQIRMRVGGSDAGHNGIKSLVQHIGKEFARVRVGITSEAKGEMDGADFVLAKFAKDEQAQMPNLTRETTSIITEYLFSGQLPHDTRSFL